MTDLERLLELESKSDEYELTGNPAFRLSSEEVLELRQLKDKIEKAERLYDLAFGKNPSISLVPISWKILQNMDAKAKKNEQKLKQIQEALEKCECEEDCLGLPKRIETILQGSKE